MWINSGQIKKIAIRAIFFMFDSVNISMLRLAHKDSYGFKKV